MNNKFTKFDIFIISTAVGLLLGSAAFGGVLVAGSALVGIGAVISTAIILHKFPRLEKFILRHDKWVDLLLFIVGYAIGARSIFGIITATYAAILVSAYLAIAKRFAFSAKKIK